MMSSFLNRPISRDLVVFGEVGLAGEVRGVSQPEMRINEVKKLGFLHAILPKTSLEGLKSPNPVNVSGVGSVQDLYERLFDR
jgi:DNA repair protein RadA/Sms